MLKQRVVTALLLLAVLLPVVFLAPPSWLAGVFAMVVLLGAWEWARLLGWQGWRAWVYAALALLMVVVVNDASSPRLGQTLLILSSAFWLSVVPWLLRRGVHPFSGALRTVLRMAGLLALPSCWLAAMALRQVGIACLLSVLVLVWAADIGAYFAGKTCGRHKLAPAISPGKSREGALGGWALVLLLAIAVAFGGWMAPNLATMLSARYEFSGMLMIATILVTMSIVGDLFESLLKRNAGVKDSSALLPGHGGILDRIDALLPVLPLAALLL